MAYILTTLFFWLLLALLVPVKQWRSYYPVLIFAALLGMVSDLCGVIYQQWVYYGPVVGGLSLWSDLGIAPAEGAVFIRLFPRNRHVLIRSGYLILWAGLNAGFEWFFVKVGWIGYDRWNSGRAFLFYLFFFGVIWVQEYWYNGTERLR